MIKGKVYKITGNNLTYFGSTQLELSTRLCKHRHDCKKGRFNLTSQNIVTDPNCKIYLVEEIEAETKEELKQKLIDTEGVYIRTNECVNKKGKLNLKDEKNMKEYKRKYMREYRAKKKNG